MIGTDEDALVCDLAETYGVWDMYGLPVETLAVLACGLKDDSRIMMKMSGAMIDPITLMMAAAVDRLTLLIWQRTKDGEKGRNKPASIVDSLLKPRKQNVKAYRTAEGFEAARQRILERLKNG